jgi:hypothetical protein
MIENSFARTNHYFTLVSFAGQWVVPFRVPGVDLPMFIH